MLETDRKAAEELALEVRTASGGPRTWRRVATLMEAFGVERLSDEVRERIAAALADFSLEVHPPLDGVERDQMVQIALPDSDTVWALVKQEAADGQATPAISGAAWGPGGTFDELSLDVARSGDTTAWFHVDPARTTPDEVIDKLWPLCRNELTREMVEDLLDSGRSGGVRSYGEDRAVRLVEAFGMEARDPPPDAAGSSSKAGELVFHPVKFLAGSDWLVTSWPEDPNGRGIAEAVRTAAARLKGFTDRPTPGDLGISVVYSLTCTYPATERRLHSWLDAWEVDFHRHLEQGEAGGLASLEKSTLIDLRRLLSELRRRLHAFEQPGADPTEAWFQNVTDVETAQRVRRLVDSTLTELGVLDDALRTSLDLLVTTSSAEQLAATQAQAAQSERLQNQLKLIASVLLVPSFLAELFGTNPYPRDGDWLDFGLLLVVMAVLALATYRLMTRWMTT